MKESIAYQYQDGHIMGFADLLKYQTMVKGYSHEHIKALQAMPYAEYLQTTHWAMLKKVAMSISVHSCSSCHKNNVEIHVHHIRYTNRGHEDAYKDVTCLCSVCHKGAHEIVARYLTGSNKQLLNSKVLDMVNEDIYPFFIISDIKNKKFYLKKLA